MEKVTVGTIILEKYSLGEVKFKIVTFGMRRSFGSPG